MTETPFHRRLATVLAWSAYALALFAAAGLIVSVGGYERRLSGRLARMNGKPTFAQVCALMEEGAKFDYEDAYHFNPQPPEVTEARRAGDCKDLALWLATRMNDPSVLFVEGHFDHSPGRHAWLEWWCDGQLWVLDLTTLTGSRPRLASRSHNPNSIYYYAPDRLITKYGAFTAKGAMSDNCLSELVK